MKKRILLLRSAVLAVLAALCLLGLAACKQDAPAGALAAPKLELSEDLSLRWNAVEGATGYLIRVNGSDLMTTSRLHWPALAAPGTYTVAVQPVAGEEKGDASNEVTYTVYGVSIPESELYTVLGAPSVGQGQPYSFTVAYAPGCENSTPAVKVNGQEITADAQGRYSIPCADSDLDITVEGVALNRYSVSLPSGTGYRVLGEQTALHGKGYTFRLELESKYDRSNAVVKVNGETLTGNGGSYTVEAVSGDLDITVSGVSVNTYAVVLNAGRGYTISPAGRQSVTYGGAISFTVTAKDPAYGITVQADGKTLTAQNGKYTIANITKDYTVKVIVDGLPELTVVDQLLEAANWKTISQGTTGETLTLSSNSSLKGSYLQTLWEQGYTHLVFTVNAKEAADRNTNYTQGKDWIRYWSGFAPNQDVDIRIDLNEFHDGNTWYNLNFNCGTMTVSKPRAYSSPETLDWKKTSTNLYFAVEDGYYVLETRTGDGVSSPTDWLAKYCIGNSAQQQTWFVYTDYLSVGNNTRSMLWGYGSPVDRIMDGTAGGWVTMNGMQTDGYTDGEVFSLHLDTSGTARFQISDMVSSRRDDNQAYTYTQVADDTFRLTTALNEHKLYLASSADLAAAGYTHLQVTFTGSLGGNTLWFGNDDWSGGKMFQVSANEMASGSYTARYDLSLLEGKPFMLMASISSGAIEDLQVKIETVGEGKPVAMYRVTLPEVKNVTVSGSGIAWENKPYTFTVTPAEGYDPAKLVVKANGQILTGENGAYTVDPVTEDLTITVENVELYSFAVHAPTGEGYTFQGAQTAQYGKDYTFKVIPQDGNNVVVTVNGTTVTGKNNSYTVTNVKEALTVAVTCTAKNTFVVTIPEGSRYTVTPSGQQTVDKGADLSFTVTAKNPEAKVTVTANGKTLTGTEGVYTLSDIRDNILVAITANTVVDDLLLQDSWKATALEGTEDSLTLAANASLKGDYLKQLWDAGYTHLVFTVNAKAAADNNTNYTHSGTWDRYWRGITANTDQTLRIDLGEFHDGDTWYSLNFNSGEMTVSDPKAYKSAETLSWTKIGVGKPSNVYFAMEDGYYVLETITAQGIQSPTQWLAKYCIGNDAQQQTWFFYTDYLTAGDNTRSALWGWGSAVNQIKEGIQGGWVTMSSMQTDGYQDGEVFSLHLDKAGTSRFQISDIVTNRNNYTGAYACDQLGDNTYRFSTPIDGQKFYLASTSELVAAGYTHLRVTLEGQLNNGALLWYGNDDWSDGEISVDGLRFVGGSYTFDVDLSTMKGKPFTLMTNAISAANPITDMQVTLEPVVKDASVVTYNVTAPLGEGFVFAGGECVDAGQTYRFTVTPVNPKATVEVQVNGQVITDAEGIYTVEAVAADLVITVTVTEPEPEPTQPTEPEPTDPEPTDPEPTDPPAVGDVVEQLLNPDSWSAGGTAGTDTLQVPANSQLKADYFKQLWDAGYTHLVFTVNAKAAADNNTNFTHSGTWSKYWRSITANTDQAIRIDLGEFHDAGTWYGINFNAGQMTVSAPKAYKSAETLQWTKASSNEAAAPASNIYLAMEDGYYVLEVSSGAQYVKSPTQWVKKYCVADDASQRSWRVYTDYLNKGDNTRSLIWGWGSPVNILTGTANGGWTWLNGMQTDGYQDGEVFSLHLDARGTARFKILDWVSNRNEWNAQQKLEYVDAQTIRWSGADSYKLRLATTQELIAAGATKLRVTLSGSLGSALIWYGEDDWSDGEMAVDAAKFTNGSYTFEVDLTAFKSTENFTLMGNAAAFTNLLVKVEPIGANTPAATYNVTAPAGDGFAFAGAATAEAGKPYTFTVTPSNGEATVEVQVNGQVITGIDGTYTVDAVNTDLVITVTVMEPAPPVQQTVVEQLLSPDSWSAGGTAGTDTLQVPANSQLKADYFKKLWDAGYTHLVFTVNAKAAADNNTNYTHSGTWDRYWRGITANTDQTLRIDLSEFRDGDTWYGINFNAGQMTVSAPKAYKSAETLQWTKVGAGKPSNVYFAVENGYYVLETITAQGVQSPTSWLKKYCIGNSVKQQTWFAYTDYINKGANTRSLLWGWGQPVNCLFTTTTGGWVTLSDMQTDGYSSGEVFSLHTDVAATARFKLSDTVSNRNGWNAGFSYTQVSDSTFRFTTGLNEHKFYLANTDELLAAGYTKLKLTFTGSVGSNSVWYGNDDWSGGRMFSVGADQLASGSYTVEYDLSLLSGKPFMLMASIASGSISNMQVQIEPVG